MSWNRSTLIMTFALAMMTSQAAAQSFYQTMPMGQMYTPVQRDDGQLFNLNPATVNPAGSKAGGYVIRRERTSTFTATDSAATTTKTSLKEDGYGIGGMFDLGAGAGAGINAERQFSTAELTVDSSRTKMIEIIETKTLTGRVLIDLAPGLRVGLALRFMHEKGDILGAMSNNNESGRVKYDGSLVGHGGGVQYADDRFAIGAAYFPAARGKTEIISEERIITEPGLTLVDFKYKADKNNVFGLGLQRAVHRRDERAVSVPGENGRGTIALDGISPDKNSFATQTVHGAVEWGIAGNVALRVGAARHQREWIFNGNAVPGDKSDGDTYSYMEWQVALHILMQVDVTAGYYFDSYETKLSSRSGTARDGAKYQSGGRVLFLSAGGKI